VSAILPQVDAATRTLRAARGEEPGTVLKPGMFVSVVLEPRQLSTCSVPGSGDRTGKRNVVIVAADNNRFVPVDVTLGRSVGSDVEVNQDCGGSARRDLGQFLIDSEASLKSALSWLERGLATSATSGRPRGAASGSGYQSEGKVEKVGAEEVMLA
jgi:Cu(I)/Ag(I) efflux system membrane fusion protein